MKAKIWIVITGVVIGTISVILVHLGNPPNMGFCTACFLRDIAGSIGLHRAAPVQYMRPEIIGLLLGAFIVALAGREFKPRGGSSSMTRFLLGICVMIGALMFLGCPLRMMLRIGGGDLNAVVGLVGFAAGIGLGIVALNKGFTLRRNHALSIGEGMAYPFLTLALLTLLVAFPTLLFFSKEGPGAMAAPMAVSLVAGLVVGGLAQRTRFCMVAGIRDTIMFRDVHMLIGFIVLIATTAIGNLILGNFNLGFENQPIAFNDGLWNFIGMLVVGFGSALLGGCPFRQVILSGEGNGDSAVTILGFIAGAAISHNFGLASAPTGPSPNGQVAVIIAFIIVTLIAVVNIKKVGKV